MGDSCAEPQARLPDERLLADEQRAKRKTDDHMPVTGYSLRTERWQQHSQKPSSVPLTNAHPAVLSSALARRGHRETTLSGTLSHPDPRTLSWSELNLLPLYVQPLEQEAFFP